MYGQHRSVQGVLGIKESFIITPLGVLYYIFI